MQTFTSLSPFKLAWEPMKANAKGDPLPWPTAVTDAGELQHLIEQEGLGYVTNTPSEIDAIFHRAFKDELNGPNDKLLWVGIDASQVLNRASFGTRRDTYAIAQGQERTFSPASIALKYRLGKGAAGMVALKASAFEPTRHKRNQYTLRPEIPEFDMAVAGLLVIAKGKPKK